MQGQRLLQMSVAGCWKLLTSQIPISTLRGSPSMKLENDQYSCKKMKIYQYTHDPLIHVSIPLLSFTSRPGLRLSRRISGWLGSRTNSSASFLWAKGRVGLSECTSIRPICTRNVSRQDHSTRRHCCRGALPRPVLPWKHTHHTQDTASVTAFIQRHYYVWT